MKRWNHISLVILALVLVLLVVGAALLVGFRLGSAPDARFEPTPTTPPTSFAGIAVPSDTPLSDPAPSGAAPVDTSRPTLEPPTATSSATETSPPPIRQPTSTLVPTTRPSETPRVRIRTFAGSPDPVARGGTVTLTWDAPGAKAVGITRLSAEGDIFLVPEALDLPARGSIDLTVPEDYVESVKYYLGARDEKGELAKAYLTIAVVCSYDEYIAPRCPLTQDHPWAAYEPFERGHMIWRGDTRDIYVLYKDGSYETYADTWQEGDPVFIPGTPPPGLYAPVRGFGNLYASQPQVGERLGWATAEESGYTMWVETIPGGSGRYPGISTYFTLPDSGVVNLYPFTSTWQKLP